MTETPTSIDLAAILAEVAQLKLAYATVVADYAALKKVHQALQERYRALEKGIFFQGREKVSPPEQGLLAFMETLAPTPPAPPPPPEESKKPRAKPTGRKPLPENLPVVPIEVLPEEVKAAGLDAFERIGEDCSETVEQRSASLVVVRIIRPKFVRKGAVPESAGEAKVLQAPALELPIERGLAGPNLLATTVNDRWDIHVPLHRMERIFGRAGWDLSRSTICDWHMALAKLAKVVVDAMWLDARKAPYLCTDATGVLVQNIDKCRRAHFFVVAAPGRHILFGFSPKHNAAAIDKLLDDYEGPLVADASTIYDHLYNNGKIKEHGCWAHVRRYFFKSVDSDSTRSRAAIDMIRKLFQIESDFKKGSVSLRDVRQQLSRPIVDSFFAWCEAEGPRVLSESPIDKAIQYALKQRDALSAFLESNEVPIHNNLSERELRREAVGRKNWLFVGSDEGGEVNATFVSLLASCRHHNIEPVAYLRDLFCLLPSWNQQAVLELSPLHWKTTVARDDVRALLEANVYRQVALGQIEPKSA